ncbi:MAG: signal peptidase II [Acholeplasmataceae bacterium]|nr:signal peptidase II [Acholeplasmataceae bacterium]
MIIAIILIIVLTGLDQATKYIAQYFLKEPLIEKTIIPKVLQFSYYENTGASWGMLEGKQTLFLIITLIALIIFGYLFTKLSFKNKKLYSISVILLLAGTLGNALDRMILNYVIDFLHLPFLTPVLGLVGISNFYFNLADLFLNLGIVLLIIDMLFLYPKRERIEKRAKTIKERSQINE